MHLLCTESGEENEPKKVHPSCKVVVHGMMTCNYGDFYKIIIIITKTCERVTRTIIVLCSKVNCANRDWFFFSCKRPPPTALSSEIKECSCISSCLVMHPASKQRHRQLETDSGWRKGTGRKKNKRGSEVQFSVVGGRRNWF